MLKKLLVSLGMVCIAFLTGYATAQSFFLNKPATANQNAAAPSQSVLSSADFQSKTEQIQKQKNEALSNQLKQNLSKVPPTPAPSTPPPASKSAPDAATTPESSKLPPAANEKSPAPAAPAAPEQSAEATGPTPTAPANAQPGQPSDVYTGFQNDQNKNQSAPASGSGWNIQY